MNTITITRTVQTDHLAIHMKSGDLEVLSTPQMIVWMEEASCLCLELEPENTSVGIQMDVQHLKASKLGQEISISSTLIEQNKRILTFQVEAYQGIDCIGKGIHKRCIVNRESFLSQI